MRDLVRVLRQGLVVEFLGLLGIQAEMELVLPAEFEARLAQRVVADLRAGMAEKSLQFVEQGAQVYRRG